MATIRRVVAFAALFLLIAVPHASADPVLITGGFITVPGSVELGTASITGTRGFTLEAGVIPSEGRVDALNTCGVSPCPPGTPLSVGANLSGSVFEGAFTLDGVLYSDISSINSPASLFFELFGGGPLPPIQDQPVLFTTPFTLTGMINLPLPLTGPSVVGRGIATVALTPLPPTQANRISGLRIAFATTSAMPQRYPNLRRSRWCQAGSWPSVGWRVGVANADDAAQRTTS